MSGKISIFLFFCKTFEVDDDEVVPLLVEKDSGQVDIEYQTRLNIKSKIRKMGNFGLILVRANKNVSVSKKSIFHMKQNWSKWEF